jgi:hypothetical protein
MPTDLSVTRLHMAEHAYPTPTRGLLSEQQRARTNRCPISNGTRTVATPVRHLRRRADGTVVELATATKHHYSDAELAMIDRRERQRRLQAIVAGQQAELDHWAS